MRIAVITFCVLAVAGGPSHGQVPASSGGTVSGQQAYLEKLWAMLTPAERKTLQNDLNLESKSLAASTLNLEKENLRLTQEIQKISGFNVEAARRRLDLLGRQGSAQSALQDVRRSQTALNTRLLTVGYMVNTSVKERQAVDDLKALRFYTESISAAAHPSYLICGEDILEKTRIRYWEADLSNFARNHLKKTESVGRVQCSKRADQSRAVCTAVGDAAAKWTYSNVGTAFVVRADVMVTNKHVVEQFAHVDAAGRWNLNAGHDVRVDFPGLYDGCTLVRPAYSRTVSEIHVLSAEDIAFLRFKESGLPSPLPINALPPLRAGEVVGVVGYPERDMSIDRSTQNLVFRGPKGDVPLGVQRIQPGEVLRKEGGLRWRNDASAMNGNSGSPVIRFSDGAVVGIHIGGYPGGENVLIEAAEIARALEKLPPS